MDACRDSRSVARRNRLGGCENNSINRPFERHAIPRRRGQGRQRFKTWRFPALGFCAENSIRFLGIAVGATIAMTSRDSRSTLVPQLRWLYPSNLKRTEV